MQRTMVKANLNSLKKAGFIKAKSEIDPFAPPARVPYWYVDFTAMVDSLNFRIHKMGASTAPHCTVRTALHCTVCNQKDPRLFPS